ncbi:uncharacterized protein PHACADRAFT_255010 [Phanerochaete carnosa HHB-10118-sp]|uniref:FAD-binding PCMH-type domain-containing protein n=1 Tax=Phanerochaete carnosa (strain HHB-10118-sp) TaxID=650164 RepID=K5V421_PHACS|nr:uncharacterized protein PHACADRAFT_255010 [Phanerochaete carnosa HHB-10118-sp]EKM57311.1 hypothetical protein PHACADRAFT_255010 [Phanerochaete carnosa HHB-10118-sp]
MRGLIVFSLFTVLAIAKPANASATNACNMIANAVSSASDVYWPGSIQYTNDVSHWANSSSAVSTCSVEPGTAEDIGVTLQILGSTNTSFAVKGGGHTTNAGFSSTAGVQIAMSRFSDVVYDGATQTVSYGMGLTWNDVYSALEPYSVNVVGGRVSDVGVAGVSLGGGYSWLTNQYGLVVDNIVGFEIVLPNGQVTNVTEANDPDLFFSVKGGYNNFGIVTQVTTRAYPQGQVWGGIVVIGGDQWDTINAATTKFQAEVTDPKAALQVIPAYDAALSETPVAFVLMFYDGPSTPAGIFDDYLAIPALNTDLSTRSFLSLVQSSPTHSTNSTRVVFNTASVTTITTGLLDAIVNETQFWSQELSNQSATFISYVIEFYLPSLYQHAAANTSAYPPTRAQGLLLLELYYAWDLPGADAIMQAATVQSAAHLKAVATSEGQDISDAPLYGNYAIAGTPVEQIFGDSLPRMRATKERVDPQNIMGLTGGWKI